MSINLNSFPFFQDEASLTRLNNLFASRSNLMPHEVASATGCSLEEAMHLLMFLYDKRMAEAYLVVYHERHLDEPPIEVRPIVQGFPSLPMVCEVCGEVISEEADLSYGFQFVFISRFQFPLSERQS